MAIGLAELGTLKDAGVFGSGPLQVLEIGRQRLRCSGPGDLIEFAAALKGKAPSKTLQRKLEQCGRRAADDASEAPATLGELLKLLSHGYHALDSVPGPDTTVFDVALDPLPEELTAGFDLVVCGMAGAVCDDPGRLLRIAHDAARAEGWLLYRVPVQAAAGTGATVDADLVIRTAETNAYQAEAAWRASEDGAVEYIGSADPGNGRPSFDRLRAEIADRVDDEAASVCLLLRKTGEAPFEAPSRPVQPASTDADSTEPALTSGADAASTDLYRYMDGKTQTILTYVESKNRQTLDHLDSRIEQVLAVLRERPDHAYLESKTTQTMEYVESKTQQMLAALEQKADARAVEEMRTDALERIDQGTSRLADELQQVHAETRRGPLKFLWRRLARLVGR